VSNSKTETINIPSYQAAEAMSEAAGQGALSSLPEIQQHVLTKRFGLDGSNEKSFRKIALEEGIPPQSARRIAKKGLEALGADHLTVKRPSGTMYPAYMYAEHGPDGLIIMRPITDEAQAQSIINTAKADLEAVWRADNPNTPVEKLYDRPKWEPPKQIPGEEYLG
jgi:hypothetical protein